MKRPTTVSGVRSVYGILSHFRQFVKNFAKIARPITSLISKADGPVSWGDDAESAFQQICASIIKGGLRLADYSLPFSVNSDFSYEGLGAVLC